LLGRRRGFDPFELLLSLMTGQLGDTRPQFLTLPEASEYSGLSLKFLARLIDARKLAALRDGRRIKVKRADLDSLPPVAQMAKLMTTKAELRKTLVARRGK
jgi:excisionase family DNA binding protein